MSFNSYRPFKKRNLLAKYLIVFLLGISFALFFSSALNIVTGIENATQYIRQIVLTSNGATNGTTGIVLDGANSKVGATYICNPALNDCSSIASIVSLINNPPSGGGILVETDPTVGSHIKSITTTNIGNRNSAFGRGNHASAGYLTVESDPQVGSTTSGQRCIGNGTQVTCNQSAPSTGDNLGNHIATSNIRLGTNYLSYGASNSGLKILSNGNVQISDLLEVSCGSRTSNKGIKVGDNSRIYDDACSAGAPAETLYLESNDAISIKSNNNNGIYINTNGNVGMGTTGPNYKLHVNGTGRFSKKLIVDGGIEIGGNSILDGDFNVTDGNIYIGDGNLGIGTTSPITKFHVNGDAYVSGINISNVLKLTPVQFAPVVCDGNNNGTMYYTNTTHNICLCRAGNRVAIPSGSCPTN